MVRIVFFAVLILSIALVPQLATAQSQGIGQGQTPGVQNPSVNQSQDTSAQIQGMLGSIRDLQQAIQDAMKELQQAIDDLNHLRAARPTPPKDNNPQEKDAYTKRKTEWQYKVTSKEHEIVATQAKINQLQKQLSNLQQQLSNLQNATGDSSGKKMPPVKVMPRR
jgi:hypothetical protein